MIDVILNTFRHPGKGQSKGTIKAIIQNIWVGLDCVKLGFFEPVLSMSSINPLDVLIKMISPCMAAISRAPEMF